MEQVSKISDVLSEIAFDKKAREFSLKKAVAFGFWKEICGSKFANFSVPYDIKGKTLLVAAKNPQVVQELIFNRQNLLKKIRNYFMPLNIDIEEIRYDFKVWNKINSKTVLVGDIEPEYYTKEEIAGTKFGEFEKEEMKNITNSISNVSCLNSEIKEKLAKIISNSIKAKALRKEEPLVR